MSTDAIESLNQRLDAQDKILSEIKTALVGNPGLGQEGVVPRLKVAEHRLDGHDRTMLKWAGVAVGMSTVATMLKDKIFG